MKRLAAVLSVIGVLIVALPVAGVAILKSMDFNAYRGLIAEQVKAATGRDLTIAGDLRLEISLEPAIAVEGVSFANAPWGSRPAMATIKKFAAEVQLLPLITGDIRVNRVVLGGLDLLLETDAKGRGNWELATAPAPSKTDGPVRLPVIKKVHLNDIKVTYRDGRSGTLQTVQLDSLAMAADGLETPLDIRLKGRHNDAPFEASGQLGPLAALIGGGKPYPVKLSASAFALAAEIEGTVAEPLAARGLDLKVALKGDEIMKAIAAAQPVVLALKDVKIPPIGPLDAKARLVGSAERLSLNDLGLSIGQAREVFVGVQGRVADLQRGQGVDVAVNIDAQNIQPLGAALGASLPRVPPLRVAARVQDTAAGYAVDGLTAKVGGSDLAGRVTLALAGKPRPEIVAALSSNAIDLKEWLPKALDKKPAVRPAAPSDGRVFPDDPLPVAALKALDADISARIARLILPEGLALDAVEAKVSLRGGKLAVQPASFHVGGGRVTAAVTLDGTPSPAALTLRVDGKDVDWGSVLGAMQITDLVQGSKAEAKIDLRGQGRSVRQIMANLNGETQIVLGAGRVRNKTLERFGADVAMQVVDALNPFAKSDEFTDLKCGVARFTVKDGLASAADGIALETGKLNVVGSGSVNLRSEAIDFAIKPEARQGLGLNLTGTVAGLVRVSGTIGEPKIALDQAGAAKTALGAGAALATGGLSLLAQSLLNRSTADESPCQTALGRKAPGQARPAADKASPAPPKEEGTLGGAVRGIGEGIGRGLKNLFGQ